MSASGYRDRAGIDSRANSALGTILIIAENTSIPAAVRLALIARRIECEPILTDEAPAAYTVREQARQYYNRNHPF